MPSTMGSSKMPFIVKACALGALIVMKDVNAQSLRKGNDRNLQFGIAPIESVTCRISVIEAQFEDQDETEVHACTVDDGTNPLGGYTYSIDLPTDFAESNKECIRNGACFVDIQGAQILDEEGQVPTVEVPQSAVMIPVDKSESVPAARRLETEYRPTLVVRVQAQSRSCTPSKSDLAGSIFGWGSREIENNMRTQYERCSNGQLSFYGVAGNQVTDGVIDVYIDEEAWGTNIFSLTNKMFEAASNVVGSSLSATPLHVMYVVPYGTEFNGSKGWVAFAHVSGYNSWYNDEWGDFLSAQVHEIGHNLGMHHSNENDQAYHDQSGMMGFSYRQKNGPLMCFNAFKNAKFGWYDVRSVNPASEGVWTGELVAFVDANAARSDQEIIVRVGNTYLQLNGAKDFNRDTQEKVNEVVLVEGTQGNVESNVIGSLADPGQVIDLNGNISIELCSKSLHSVFSARISIFRRNNQSSGCYTNAPTPSPVSSPSYNPYIGITRFALIDTELDQEISWGSSANHMTIQAVPFGPVESVQMILTGPVSHTQNENAEPYMLNGDMGLNNAHPIDLPSGSYRIECTAYPENYRGGWASQTAVLDFTIP